MSSENDNPKEEKKPEDDKNMFEEAVDSLSKGYEEKKDAIGKSITETKESVSKSIDSGVKKTKSFFKKVLIFGVIASIVAGAVFMLWSNYTISDGSRTGYMVKLSKKGIIFKTHEGQLNLGGLQSDNSSILGNVWDFSLTDHDLVKKLEDLEGEKIILRYKEINRSMPWQGDTNYFVYDVVKK